MRAIVLPVVLALFLRLCLRGIRWPTRISLLLVGHCQLLPSDVTCGKWYIVLLKLFSFRENRDSRYDMMSSFVSWYSIL